MPSYSDLEIPLSSSTVTIKLFDGVPPGEHSKIKIPAEGFFAPLLAGHEHLECPLFTFLIEHPATKKRVMFDLGMRKDLDNAAPGARIMKYLVPPTDVDIVDQLEASGVTTESISAVIWSHAHVDHIGDISKFPPSTELVVNSSMSMETYETDPQSALLPSDFAGRNLVKIDFDHTKLTIGGFKAHDYFGDGSFYLLDVPGHLKGHICGLARVTPRSFVLMGGDACHHPGVLRPTELLQKHYPCPGHLIESTRTSVSHHHFCAHSDSAFDVLACTAPLLQVSNFCADITAAQDSVDKLTVFDANDAVFVVLAHDTSLVPLFAGAARYPVELNSWKEEGLKEKAVWAFLDDKNPAFRFNVAKSAVAA
ncbi:beta-lactamase-like protein [Mycena amicta]|nr:beta-lactamase-like protein [Mycena amicta]